MPVYEFVCLECKKNFEVIQAIGKYKPAAVKCPKCGSKKVERHWSSVFVETSKKS
jgi:putative FmdB family regulatory protein